MVFKLWNVGNIMEQTFDIKEKISKEAYINESKYLDLYKKSMENSGNFWEEQAKKFITWDKTWNKVNDSDFKSGKIGWFLGGKLNACYNCLDRHLAEKKDQVAIIWEGNNPEENKKIRK